MNARLGLLIAAAVLVLCACGTVIFSGSSSTSSTSSVTSAEYSQIQSGMTRDQVTTIMGSPGVVQSEGDMGAGATFAVVEWRDASFHAIIVTFLGGKVSGKSAVGF